MMAEEAVKPETGTAGGAPTRGPLGYGRGVVMLAGGFAVALIPALVGGSIAMADAMTTPPAAVATQDPTDGSTTDPGRDSGQDDGQDGANGSDQDGTTGQTDDNGSDQTDGTDQSDEQATEYKDDVIHTVAWGETLTSISRDYGVSVDMLAEYNHIRDVDLIYADSAMLVPYSQLKIPVDE